MRYEVELTTWVEDHFWPVGLMYDTHNMEEVITIEETVDSLNESHVWLEEAELEWIIEVGSDLYLEETTGEVIDLDVQGPGGVILTILMM